MLLQNAVGSPDTVSGECLANRSLDYKQLQSPSKWFWVKLKKNTSECFPFHKAFAPMSNSQQFLVHNNATQSL